MLLAPLRRQAAWQPLFRSPLFERSLAWISERASEAREGIHELGELGWFVNVHGYTTQARELCTWENHPATIDLQYLIEGVEGIDLTDRATLGQPTLYKVDSDTEKFAPHEGPVTSLVLVLGDLVIFVPGEAHRPKIAVGAPCLLRKLVVKLPVALLG